MDTKSSGAPSRTFTFLFADLAGSTQLWERFPEAMKAAMARHDALLWEAVENAHGHVVKTTGDGLMAVFVSALDGVFACLNAQISLLQEPWGEPGPLRVRMGLHIGEATPRDGDYYGRAVNRAARLMGAAHGGQVVLSAAAASLVADLLPEGVTLRDLGEHRLKDLARPERIFQLLHPDLRADFPPLATLSQRLNNLPAQPTPLIGRETELGEILARLKAGEVRLLTLTGPGGIGKTRLALQAAAELVDGFEAGVYLIDLAPFRDPVSFPIPIAQTLGFRETSDRPLLDELVGQLRDKRMLLLLDNFEQITAAAPQAAKLLQGCPHLKLLVTSREALHLRGEFVFPVPPLALPKAEAKPPSAEQLSQYEAVRLFIERAQAVKPDFQVTNETAPAVAEICTRLDGLPLAIELAAARIRLFPPQTLLERLGSRLSLLRGGSRDLPVRQQALRSAVDWSYELLEAAEQRLFELFALFAGGSTFEAVETVAGGIEQLNRLGLDILDGLASLVEKSLVRQEEPEAGDTRLLMLETIREYASERLEADPDFSHAARLAHAAYFAGFTQRQWDRLTGAGRQAALEALEADIENVRLAWRFWVQKEDLEQLGKFVNSLWLLYEARGWYHASIELTTDMLAVLASNPDAPGRLQQEIVLQASLARALLAVKGYTAEVEEAYTRALELSQSVGEIPQLFPVLRGLANYYLYRAEIEKAARMGEKILSLAESLGDADMSVEGHLVLGYNLAFLDHMDQGMDHLEQARAGYDPDRSRSRGFALGSDPGVVCLSVSALFLWVQGFPDRALERANSAVALAGRLKHPYSLAYALFHASMLHLWRREGELVRERAQAALDIAEEHGFQVWRAVATAMRGAALAALGQAGEGLAQVQQGIRLYQGLNTPPVFWTELLYLQAEAHGRVGQYEEGLAVLETALQIFGADSEFMLSVNFFRLKGELLLALSPENQPEAETWFLRSLKVARKLKMPVPELRAAVNLSRLWQAQGNTAQARQVVSEAYAQFTEGFATVDLVEARELLDN
jgi:predicted ATPase/class 3 adenylate cyclase